MEHMVDAMVDCLDEYPAYRLNNAFLTLFNNYNTILQLDGDNDYAITHMSKEKLMKEGKLPTFIKVIKKINKENETQNIINNTYTLNIADSSSDESTVGEDE